MDAIEFVKQLRRMNEKQVLKKRFIYLREGREIDSPEDVVAEVEKWAKENPRETRQSLFIKQYPKVTTYKGVVCIRPCQIEEGYTSDYCSLYGTSQCVQCRKEYWLQEVE